MTAVDSDGRECLDGPLWEDTIRPRLARRDSDNEDWWAGLVTADPELADTVRRALKHKLADINDQLGQRGAAYEGGRLTADEFFRWRAAALGFKRLLTGRYDAVLAAEAAVKAKKNARRAEVALANIAQQSAATAAKNARLAWLDQRAAEHGHAARAALLDLALAVDQHRRETGPAGTEVDRLLWAVLGRLTMPPIGPGAEPDPLDAVVARIQAGRAGRGKPPTDNLRNPR